MMSNSNNNGAAGRSRSRSSSNTTNGSKKTYSNEKYTAVIEAMVLRAHMVEGREGYSPDHHHHRLVRHQPGQGPLLPQELADLSLLCSANSSSSSKNKNQATTKKSNRQEQQQQEDAALKGFASVDGDQLAALIELLDKHVNLAARVSLIEDALNIIKKAGSPSIASDAIDQWLKRDGTADQELQKIRLGLEASSILLSIVTSAGVDMRAVNEDAIESCIILMRSHLTKNLIPSLNQTGHLLQTKTVDPLASPRKKRRRSSAADADGSLGIKHLKKVYKLVLRTVHLHLVLMDRLENLVHHVPIDDQAILALTNGSLLTLTLDTTVPIQQSSSSSSSSSSANGRRGGSPAQQLQLGSIALVMAVFRKYPMHRDTVLEDLFPIMLDAPSGKRSMRAFPVRYASSHSPASLAALNSSVISPLMNSNNCNHIESNAINSPRSRAGTQQHFIQMTTAMVLSLVQACILQPTYEDFEGMDANGDVVRATRMASGLRGCHAIGDYFIAELLKRCARHKGGGASEFRPILSNLVEDILMVLLVPEYPASEILLFCMIRRLNSDLTKASSVLSKNLPKDKEPPDQTYLNACFDALGKICSAEARILAAHRNKPLVMTAANDVAANYNGDEMVIRCYCNRKTKEEMMIMCDRCQTYSYGSCVGINNENFPEQDWFCDSCRLLRITERERRRHQVYDDDEDDEDSCLIDEVYALHHSFLSSLSHRMGVPEIGDATKFHSAKWIDELGKKASGSEKLRGQEQRIVAHILEHWDRQGLAGDPLTEEGGNRSILALKAKTLSRPFKSEIRFLLQLLSDETSPALRKSALKTIEKTVEGDPQLMLLPIITNAVSRRLKDSAISVREAAVSLVGTYVSHSPAVANNFHSSLLACLKDEGLSVRKTSVRMFQSILPNPAYRGRSMVCHAMLQLAGDPKEEDAVRDLIHDLFVKLWLEDGEAGVTGLDSRNRRKSFSPSTASLTGSVVTPTPSSRRMKGEGNRGRKRADIAAEQMMEVVRAGGTGEHLETLLKTLLEGTTDADKGRKKIERKRKKELSRKQCDQRVDALFELLVSIEEDRDSRGGRIGKDLAATLQTIAVFVAVSPQSVLRHIDTVLPYLKADNGVSSADESSIVKASCDIMCRVSPSLDQHELERLDSGSLSSDLVWITYQFGPVALASAIHTLSALTHHIEANKKMSFGKKLLQLARQFYSYLYRQLEVEDFTTVDEKVRCNTHRGLAGLGLICRHYEPGIDSSSWGDEVDSKDEGVLPADQLDLSNVVFLSYRIISKFLDKVDPPTQCAALRALGGIFVSQPRLLLELEQVGLIDKVMSSDADVSLQVESLQCWRTILLTEEKRIDGGEADDKLAEQDIALSKRIEGDQDGDSTLFGGVLTSHTERLFEMTSDRDVRLRYSAVELLGLLLRQGLVNPNEAVPFLFALQGDLHQSQTRFLALRLLMTEGEKRPNMLRQRICAGVKEAYKFQRASYPDKKEVSALITVQQGTTSDVECIFGRVFKECVSKNRKQRQGLFKNLLTLFEWNDETQGETKQSKRRHSKPGNVVANTDLDLLSFASQILAHLPYSSANDPLFIIHNIGSIIALQGPQILDQFASILRPAGLSSNDEYDEINTKEDALELAARSKFPSRTEEARSLSSEKLDLPKFVELCQHGAALVLLLRLKSFLRRLYNLSEIRCLEYDPSAKERFFEKGIGKAEFSKLFDASVPEFQIQRSKTSNDIDKNALIRQYAEFRQLMREESTSENHMDADMNSSSDDDENIFSGQKRTVDDTELQ